MDFPINSDLLQLLEDYNSTEINEKNISEELELWSNVKFNFLDDSPSNQHESLPFGTDPLPVLGNRDSLQMHPLSESYDTKDYDVSSAVGTLDNSIFQRKKREPVESADDKRKRNSEASARFRQRRKEKEVQQQKLNEYLVVRNKELEATVEKQQMEIRVLKNLLLERKN